MGVTSWYYARAVTYLESYKSSLDYVKHINTPIKISVINDYLFLPEDGISIKRINDVGLTYYSRGDGYTPGKITRSGRFVNAGVIAVSDSLWGKEVLPGDLVHVTATGRWYRVEDTMHSKYKENRVDIYTHDMKLANSGSSKTDIFILRQPK
jgi:3D (Asp-Asp-Asp) domain-containing protein